MVDHPQKYSFFFEFSSQTAEGGERSWEIFEEHYFLVYEYPGSLLHCFPSRARASGDT